MSGMGGSEAGSYVRLTDFVFHSTLGLRVFKKKRKKGGSGLGLRSAGLGAGSRIEGRVAPR